MRVVRIVVGPVLVMVATVLMLVAVGLWTAGRHRGAEGAFTASVQRLSTDGYAIVVPDVDALLREEAPFVRGGQTTLRLSGTGRTRLFIGLAPRATVERYLAEAARTEVTRVRLTRGPLPVDAAAVRGGEGSVPKPGQRPFWYATSHFVPGVGEELSWSPAVVRNRQLALVVMNADASAQVDAALIAHVSPHWLDPTVWGLFVLGAVLFGLGAAAPARPLLRATAAGPGTAPATAPIRTSEPVAKADGSGDVGADDEDDDDAGPRQGETDPEDTVEMDGEPLISAGMRVASTTADPDLVGSR